jgi:antitoxin component YwqK of YwqJK toxin-antitoxin module
MTKYTLIALFCLACAGTITIATAAPTGYNTGDSCQYTFENEELALDAIDEADGVWLELATGKPLDGTVCIAFEGVINPELGWSAHISLSKGKLVSSRLFTHDGALHSTAFYVDGKPVSGFCGNGRELKPDEINKVDNFGTAYDMNCMTDRGPIRRNPSADKCQYDFNDDVIRGEQPRQLLSKATNEPITGIVCMEYADGDAVDSYKNGVPDGISRIYNKHGILISEVTYKDGKRHGIYRLYDSNGILKMESIKVEE